MIWGDYFGLTVWARSNHEPLKMKEGKKNESERCQQEKHLMPHCQFWDVGGNVQKVETGL